MTRERLLDVDRATGLAIGLVVIGHFAAGEIKAGAEWYFYPKYVLYSFHMAFFMYLSGIIMYYAYQPLETFMDYKKYVYKKFIRFIPPLLLFSVIIFFGKILAGSFLLIDNPVEFYSDYFKVLYSPQNSFSVYLWYIYVLFECYLFVSLCLMFFGKIEYLLIPSIILHFCSATDLMALSKFCEYLLYFVIGCVCVKHYKVYVKYLDLVGGLCLVIFSTAVFYSCYICLNQRINFNPFYNTIMGLLSIPALHYLVRLPVLKKITILYVLRTYCFPIYLMNSIAIGIIKGVFFRVTGWNYHQFHIIFPLLIAGGLYLPIVTKKYLIRYIPSIDKMIY